jgi:hypothetical protein
MPWRLGSGARMSALLVSDRPTLMSARTEVIAMVARLRLPAMYGFREFADAGGLMSYGYNLPDTYRGDTLLSGAAATSEIQTPRRVFGRCSAVLRRCYFARLQTRTAEFPPTDGAGLVYFSSSPVIETLVLF